MEQTVLKVFLFIRARVPLCYNQIGGAEPESYVWPAKSQDYYYARLYSIPMAV